MKPIFRINTKTTIATALFFAVLLPLLSLLLKNRPEQIIVKPNATFSPPVSDKVEIRRQPINNFYKTSTFTYPDGNTVLTQKDYYSIYFDASNKLFSISIYNPDIINIQSTAEQDFLNILGVNQEKACGLSVEVEKYNPFNLDVDPQIEPLSFCK